MVCWILGQPGFAQLSGSAGFDGPAADGPPASFVLDQAELFRTDPKTLQAISDRLAGFHDRHGMPLYLAVYGGLISSTANERAVDLRQRWLGERYGFVLVFDTDTGQLGMGRPIEVQVEGAGGDPAAGVGRIPSYELVEIMLKVRSKLDENPDRISHLDHLTKELVAEFEACLARLEEPVPRRPMLLFGLVVLGVIAAVALVALIAMRWVSDAEERAGQSFRFPEILVGHRLGAPSGGGRISSTSFRRTGGAS